MESRTRRRPTLDRWDKDSMMMVASFAEHLNICHIRDLELVI